MKFGTMLTVLLVGGAALVSTVWVARSGSPVPVKKVSETTDKDGPPPISPTGPHPRAVLSEPEHNFGVMAIGESDKHVFVIHNEGEAPLVLKKGTTTCKCTLSDLAKNDIPPGESAEIELEWNPRSATSSFRETAAIWTNDPENTELNLVISGRVDRIVTLTPNESWNLGEIPDDGPVEVTGTVHSALLDEFQVLNIESTNPLLTAEPVPLTPEELEGLEAKSGYSVKTTLAPGVPVGRFRETLTIQTDIRDGTDLDVSVQGNRPGPIRLLPTPGVTWHPQVMLLSLGEFAASQGSQATLAMFVTGLEEEQDLEILDVDSDVPFLQVRLEPDPSLQVPNRKRYRLTFEVPPGSPSATRVRESSANVLLTTNHPHAEQVKFRVEFISF